MGPEVMVAPGLFYVDCSSGPSEAGEVIVDGLNWHLLGVSLLGRISLLVKSEWLWGQWIHTWMPWATCLYLAFGYGLGNLPPTFLNS